MQCGFPDGWRRRDLFNLEHSPPYFLRNLMYMVWPIKFLLRYSFSCNHLFVDDISGISDYHTKKIHLVDTSILTFVQSRNMMLECAMGCEMSLSLLLCSSCQPLVGNGVDMDDAVSLSMSLTAAPGKGFHAFARYLFANDACGLCRVELGEGNGSFAKEILAAANGSRWRQTFDGILVAMGLSYLTVYLFSTDANIRHTFWQPIRAPLPESSTSQNDTLAQKAKETERFNSCNKNHHII